MIHDPNDERSRELFALGQKIALGLHEALAEALNQLNLTNGEKTMMHIYVPSAIVATSIAATSFAKTDPKFLDVLIEQTTSFIKMDAIHSYEGLKEEMPTEADMLRRVAEDEKSRSSTH